MKILIYIWIFVIGAIMGSFLACMGYRIPNKIKTTFPSSFCPKCKKSLKWYMNVPIVSYIFLKGKCHFCKEKIGAIYFLCEVLCAVLYLISYITFGFTLDFFVSIVLVSALITIIVSDFMYYYISDRVLIISAIAILIALFVFLPLNDVLNRVVSAIILFLVMLGLKILGNSMFNKESLGDGDIKLMALVGLSLGLFNSFIALFFGAVLALIYGLIIIKKNSDGILPFGPFIMFGALIVVYFSSTIVPYMENLFSL